MAEKKVEWQKKCKMAEKLGESGGKITTVNRK